MRRPRGTPRPIGQRRCIDRIIVALGAVVMLAMASCIHVPVPLSYRLSSAMERDGVLPEGVVCRQSPSTQYVCIFGATDRATQDLVVEATRESLRRLAIPRQGVTVQFWSGEPPPRGVPISIKETGRPIGEPPSTEQAESNARYGISLIRTVKIEAPLGETAP